jgi:peptidoglycan hydrolase CwlO-like protein
VISDDYIISVGGNINKFNLYNKIKRSGAIIALVLLSFNPMSTYALTQDEAKAELNKINQEISSINASLSGLAGQKKTLANELESFNSQIYAIELKIQATQREIDIITSETVEIEAKIVQTEIDLKKQKEIMSEYLRVMYMDGQVSTLELIASSNSFSDFIDQSEYMTTMQQKVQETAEEISKAKETLEEKKKELTIKKETAEQLRADQLSQKSEIDDQRAQKNYLLAVTNGSEAEYQKQLSGKLSRKGVLSCIAAGGCGGDSNGDLIVTNTSPYYNQADSRWADKYYDPPANTSTFGDYGCLITSLAMVRSYFGNPTDPVKEAGYHSYSNGLMLGWDFGGRPKVNVTDNWSAIDRALDSGKPVIVGVRMTGGSYWSHYIVMMSRSGNKYYVNDPYFSSGRTYSLNRVFAAYTTY